jgi:hypothetical protein
LPLPEAIAYVRAQRSPRLGSDHIQHIPKNVPHTLRHEEKVSHGRG